MGNRNILYSNERSEIDLKKERRYYFISGGIGFSVGLVTSSLLLFDILSKSGIIRYNEIFDFPLVIEPIYLIGALVLLFLSSLYLLSGIILTKFRIYIDGIMFPRWRIKDITTPRFVSFDNIENITIINSYYFVIKLKNNRIKRTLYYVRPDLSINIKKFIDILKERIVIEEITRKDRNEFTKDFA